MAVLHEIKTRVSLHWGLALFGAVGLFGYVLRSVGWFTEIPGDLGDARFNSVVLEHLFLWTRGLTDGLWDPGYFYPFDNTLAFSDNHFGSGIIYVLSRYVGMDRIASFQIWFVFGNILNLISAYYVLRKLGFSTFAAGLGAFVFAFALPVLAKEGHAQLVYRFASPLALLAFWRGLDSADPKQIGICALWVAWQFYCSIYVGFFLSLLLLALSIGLVVTAGPKWLGDRVRHFVAAKGRGWAIGAGLIAVAGILVGALLQVYSTTGSFYNFQRGFGDISIMLPRIQSYFLSDYSTIWGQSSRQIGESLQNRHEHQMFLGLGVILLMLVGMMVAWRRDAENRLIRASTMALVLLAALTLVTPFGTLYSLVAHLPGTSSIRAVARIIVIMVLPVALLCALGADWLRDLTMRWRSPAHAMAALALISFFTVGESLSFEPNNTPESVWRSRQAALEMQLPESLSAASVLYVTDVQGADPTAYLTELDAVIVAQAHHIPTLNGYSGNVPPGYIRPSPCTEPSMRLTLATDHLRESVKSIDSIVEHIEMVSVSPCPMSGRQLLLRGPIDDEIVALISINVRNGDQPGQFVGEVRNLSDRPVATQSADGHPILASWRIVPRDSGAEQFGWVTRIPIEMTIDPGIVIELPFEVQGDELNSARAIELSLVQEGYFWFHDRGMDPGRLELVTQ